MEAKELNEVLRLHKLWLENEPEGEHANLRYADLEDANLEDANLSNADLSNANLSNADLSNADLSYATLFTYGCHSDKIIQLSGMLYHIYIMDNHIKIGCKAYTREEWQNFTDEEILKMDGKDGLRFWKQYKDTILSINTK